MGLPWCVEDVAVECCSLVMTWLCYATTLTAHSAPRCLLQSGKRLHCAGSTASTTCSRDISSMQTSWQSSLGIWMPESVR